MDLNGKKRERQPNWTESEKLLLLSLTNMHRSILESKGSDTMSIKRKSLAWDEITFRMKAAGYNRSKDRLKQQLGRIRSAQRAKVALQSNYSLNQCADGERISSIHVEEEIHIKDEKAMDTEDDDAIIKEDGEQTSMNDVINLRQMSDISNVENSQYQNDLEATSTNINCKSDQSMSNKDVDTCRAGDILDKDHSHSTNTNQSLQGDGRQYRRIKLSGICAPSTRERRLRQIHLYRIAVERERIRNLKEQQRRDRVLYRKDIQIQNLKLNILRNLSNQNKDGNNINF